MENCSTPQDATNNTTPISDEAKYAILAILIIMCLLGLVLNGIIILMIYQHVKLRTTSNMLVLSLAIGDILKIVSRLIQTSISKLDWMDGRIVPIFLVSLNAWTIATMSIRYYVSSVYPIYKSHLKISDKKETLFYIVILWVWCFVLSLPELAIFIADTGENSEENTKNYQEFVSIWNLIFNVCLPVIIIAVMSWKTFFNVVGNVNITVGGTHKYWCKKRSARVLLNLTIICMFCYFPMSLWDVLYIWIYSPKKGRHLSYICVYCIYILSFTLIPIALYCSSNVFRRYCHKTIKCSKDERPTSMTPRSI